LLDYLVLFNNSFLQRNLINMRINPRQPKRNRINLTNSLLAILIAKPNQRLIYSYLVINGLPIQNSENFCQQVFLFLYNFFFFFDLNWCLFCFFFLAFFLSLEVVFLFCCGFLFGFCFEIWVGLEDGFYVGNIFIVKGDFEDYFVCFFVIASVCNLLFKLFDCNIRPRQRGKILLQKRVRILWDLIQHIIH